MEIELKFLVEDQFARDRILQDKYLEETAQKDSKEEIRMNATYFDTEDLDLCKNKMALRVRFENGKPVVTLKWGGSSQNGLHVRGELNVHVSETFIESPDIDVFKESEIYEEIKNASCGKKLMPLMQVECLRKQMMVDTGKSISVVSLDVGKVITPKGDSDISELEIELYSGDQSDMIELGKRLATKYNLKESNVSKFQRGLELMELQV